MNGKIIYLNAWLNCPDDTLRSNYRLQEKIHYAKAQFFYQLKEQGVNNFQIKLCYDRWVYSNRGRIKLEKNEVDSDLVDDDIPPAS